MNRRSFLTGAGATLALGFAGSAARLRAADVVPMATQIPPREAYAPVNARADRMVRLTVCLRPFRAQGPRIETEKIGSKTVIHNYGHGGSGWSLSWGSGTVAMRLATATGEREYAVIGCGAIGLTTAVLLQRAGMKVTIYAKARPPEVFSSYATGVWSPDSRIALQQAETPEFVRLWEEMCRTSHRTFQNMLSLPGNPVEWFERYTVTDVPYDQFRKHVEEEEGMKFSKFPQLAKELMPASEDFPSFKNPFAAPFVRRAHSYMFNLTTYSQHLIQAFTSEGGRIVKREFSDPSEFETLPEKTIVNATGYGAKALMKDDSITPVRGQLCALIPQHEVNYGIVSEGVSMVPRRDGIIVQASQKSDYGNTDLVPKREESEQAIAALAKIYARMRA